MQLIRLLRFFWSHPLNQNSGWAAISRVLRWQIASRLLPEAVFGLPFVNDSKLFMHRGMTGATGNWYCGLHEVDDMGFVLHMLRPGDLFIDVGANIGSYSVLAAAGTGASVVAVEPIPTTFAHLTENLKLNHLESLVDSHCVGLSNKSGKLSFTATLDTVNHVLADGESGVALNIDVVTMDSLLKGRVPTVIKIDVEGHELAVLEGGSQTLSAPGLLGVVMEINGSGARYGVNDCQLVDLMAKYGFTAWSYCAKRRTFKTAERSPVSAGGNTIFLRNCTEASFRVRSAQKTRLVNGWI